MNFVETPIQAIRSAIDLFVFACFVQDATGTNKIDLNTFNKQMKLEDDRKAYRMRTCSRLDARKIQVFCEVKKLSK